MSQTISRIVLCIAIALVACTYIVSAAPIADSQLEAGSSFANTRINILKKKHNDEEEEEEESDAATTTTGRYNRKHSKTTTTESSEPTSTKTSKKKKNSTSTTTEATPTSETTKKSASSSSSSGSYSGDGTYYDVGLGSCGWTNSDSEMIVALNHVQMENGANSNNNPNCGKKIAVSGPKGTVTVKIVDTCPGCDSGSVDLSPAAFEKIADLSQGRVPVTWDFV
ncbi:MAG: RlpA-like double-psi beta-barrel-protein domain-containing protein-containing protein [Benjaminiella poitrasii]|nr:MAG: RlpA-like double-psi beta-barrel-protein domain-containing protein-containing protein [Benjaminiella poitrasii]